MDELYTRLDAERTRTKARYNAALRAAGHLWSVMLRFVPWSTRDHHARTSRNRRTERSLGVATPPVASVRGPTEIDQPAGQ